jgi:hypothetical protein
MWQYIDRKIKKRKDDGKSTDVIYTGKRLRQAAIQKGIQRHRETNTLVRIAQCKDIITWFIHIQILTNELPKIKQLALPRYLYLIHTLLSVLLHRFTWSLGGQNPCPG